MSSNKYIEQRAKDTARYIIQTGCTVRAAAKKFGVSKSTVHKDVTERLAKIDTILYYDVHSVLIKNKNERHLRGGLATKTKYLSIKNTKNTP